MNSSRSVATTTVCPPLASDVSVLSIEESGSSTMMMDFEASGATSKWSPMGVSWCRVEPQGAQTVSSPLVSAEVGVSVTGCCCGT